MTGIGKVSFRASTKKHSSLIKNHAYLVVLAEVDSGVDSNTKRQLEKNKMKKIKTVNFENEFSFSSDFL